MNADLTFNAVAFKKSYDTKDESLRQSITRGINEPDALTIRSMDYVDSKTKVPGRRYLIRLDRTDIDANSTPIVQTIATTIAVPSTSVQADLDVLVATFKAAVADADLIAKVLNNEK